MLGFVEAAAASRIELDISSAVSVAIPDDNERASPEVDSEILESLAVVWVGVAANDDGQRHAPVA